MAIDEFRDFMAQVVEIEPQTGRDGYNKPTFGPAVKYQARVSGKQRMVKAADGRDVVASQTIYLGDSIDVSVNDQITLPDGYSPRQPNILSVSRIPDENGLHHTTIYVG